MFSCRFRSDAELRLLEERHAEALFALTEQDRRQLREWLPWVDPTRSVEDTRRYIQSTLAQFAANDGLAAGIWCTGELAGAIALHKIDWPNRNSSIGYWLAAPFQGKGLVTDACRTLVTHAFCNLGLNRLEIRCATGNQKSRAIPERLGFMPEGVIRQAQWINGRFVDLAIYGMLNSDWSAERHSGASEVARASYLPVPPRYHRNAA